MNENYFYKTCIQSELSKRVSKNKAYSLRAFAKALKLEPGALSQILSGKRVPSYKAAEKILSNLELTPIERRDFLNSLAEHQQARGLQRLSPAFREPVIASSPQRELSADAFHVIGDWYHIAVMLLAETRGFQFEQRWIAAQLGISVVEAKLAMERLVNLGLLQSVRGRMRLVDQNITTADKSLTTPALRRRQKQILEKAITSLENDPIEIRSMTGMTMAIDSDKIPQAKKLIFEFNQKMSQLLETGKRTSVYELQISLFPLQQRSSS